MKTYHLKYIIGAIGILVSLIVGENSLRFGAVAFSLAIIILAAVDQYGRGE